MNKVIMSGEREYDEFDSDNFDSEKFSKIKKPFRYNSEERARKDNWRDKRKSKEKDRNKFFDTDRKKK